MDGSPNRPCWSLRCSDFGFESDYPLQINKPQFGMPVILYGVYRFLVFAYFISYFVYDMVTTIEGFDGVKTFIFLTTWTFILVNLYIVVALINTIIDLTQYRSRENVFPEKTPLRHKIQWFLFAIAINASIMICCAFWSIYNIYPQVRELFSNMLHNINIHLLPAIFTLIDLVITTIPVRFVHVIYPLIFGAAYSVFEVVYWRVGGTSPWGLHFIYPMINFDDDPRGAVVVMVAMTGAVVALQVVLKGLYLLRECVAGKINPSYSSLNGTSNEHRPLTAPGGMEMSSTQTQ